MNRDDEFTRVIYKPDQFQPQVWHRALERVQVGSKMFGLLPVYKWQYTEWKKAGSDPR
jgi:hypothetical protein